MDLENISKPIYSSKLNEWGIQIKFSNYFISYSKLVDLVRLFRLEVNNFNYSIPIEAFIINKSSHTSVKIWIDRNLIMLSQKLIRDQLKKFMELEQSIFLLSNHPCNLPYDIINEIKKYTIEKIIASNLADSE